MHTAAAPSLRPLLPASAARRAPLRTLVRAPLRAFLRPFLRPLLLPALLLFALAPAPQAHAQAKAKAQGPAAKKWLVLAPLGLSPAEDKDGFNKTYGGVASSFANALQGALKPGGIQGTIVIDQTPTSAKPTVDKIRQHLGASRAGVLLVLTMFSEDSANGRTMNLRLQYAEVEWQTTGPNTDAQADPKAPPKADPKADPKTAPKATPQSTGFKLSHPLVRDYWLWNEKQGNNPENYASMAKDFLGLLSKEGRLK